MSFRNDSLIVQMVHDNLIGTYNTIEFVGNHLRSENPELKGEAERILRNLQKYVVSPVDDIADVLSRVQKLTGSSVDPRQYVERLKKAYESGEDMDDILSDAKKACDYIKTFLG